MISSMNSGNIDTLVGLSTDTKPTNKPNGTFFLEMDTSEVYCWDLTAQQWRKI